MVRVIQDLRDFAILILVFSLLLALPAPFSCHPEDRYSGGTPPPVNKSEGCYHHFGTALIPSIYLEDSDSVVYPSFPFRHPRLRMASFNVLCVKVAWVLGCLDAWMHERCSVTSQGAGMSCCISG